MYCKKKETRTIFELFKEYNCEDCNEYLDIEEIKIGYNYIRIYYMGRCKQNYNETISKKRSKLLFKDIYIDSLNKNSNNVFLWLSLNDDLSNYYEWFSDLIDYGYNIHIII